MEKLSWNLYRKVCPRHTLTRLADGGVEGREFVKVVLVMMVVVVVMGVVMVVVV